MLAARFAERENRWRLGSLLLSVCLGGLLVIPNEETLLHAEQSDTTSDFARDLSEVNEQREVKLYQLLYDYQLTDPMSLLGQKVRILIWLKHMEFSGAQQELLLNLARKFMSRRDLVRGKESELVRGYEEKLEPVYERIYSEISRPTPDEAHLEALARELSGLNLLYRREDELHSLRVKMVRTVLADEESFLHTLSPEQEERLVTSLFFLREQIDPFANPDTYRRVIGPTWNAGDFTPLLRRSSPRESHMNIGGLWGLDVDGDDSVNYSDIRRPIVLFFVLKEPALVPTLEENLQRIRGGTPGQAARSEER